MTYGGQAKFNGRDLDGVCRMKFANLLCMYGCPGFDTYGPFKLVGGMNKGRPNQEDIDGAVAFTTGWSRITARSSSRSAPSATSKTLQRRASSWRPDVQHQALGEEDR